MSTSKLNLLIIVAMAFTSGAAGEVSRSVDQNTHSRNTVESPLIVSGTIEFGIEGLDYEDIAEDIPGWLDGVAARGITLVGLSLIDISEGFISFDSETLRTAGFTEDPDYGFLYPTILREAKKRGLKIIVMIEHLAHIISGDETYSSKIDVDKLTPNAVAQVIRELDDGAEKEGVEIGINEEAYDDAYVNAISRATKERGVFYIHFFEDLDCRADYYLSEDYAYYPYDGRSNAADQEYLRHLTRMMSYFGELGNLNVMYGAARGCGVPAGVLTAGGWGMGPKTHQNIALLRSVQYGPRQFFFVVAEGNEGVVFPAEDPYVMNYDFNKKLLPLVEEYGKRSTDTPKPIANYIIDQPTSGSDLADMFALAQLSSASAITNALLSAGYDIVVTRSNPYSNAQLYYVFSPGLIFGEGGDLPSAFAELPSTGVPVFYQVAGELPNTTNWNRVRTLLGMTKAVVALFNEDETSVFDPIPEKVAYSFPSGSREVRYGGVSLEVWIPELAGKFSIGHYLNYIAPADVDGELLLTGKTSKDGDGLFDDESALIVKKGNVFFVNGGYLHLDASSILANIMATNPIFNRPSYGYFSNGKNRAAFYAPYEVDIDLNLLGGTKVTEFDETGEQIFSTLSLENQRLSGKVKKFHLLVIN